MDQNLLIAAALVGSALLGLLVGVIAGKRSASSFKRNQHLEKELLDTQLELDSYKKEVEQHFSETADAFKSLNDSYATLHQKLAGGAMNLYGDAVGPMLAAPGEKSEMPAASEQQGEEPLEPPRDYAPKKSPDEKGMLTEDFGLHKPNQSENDAT